MEAFLKHRSRLPATLSLIAVVLLASWMGGVSGGYFVAGWAPPAFLLAALIGVGMATGAFRGTKIGPARVAITLFAAYTAWTFASMLWAPNRGEAWLGAGLTLLYLLVFCAAVALTVAGASRRWVLTAMAVGPSVLAAFVLLSLGSGLDDLFENNRLVGTVGYYNGMAAFVLVPFWTAIYAAGSRRVPWPLRGAALAGAVLSVDVAVLTQSRGAVVAMAVSLLAFFVVSGQRLRGFLALAPVAGALLMAFPGLNRIYVALLEGGDAVAAVDRVFPAVWLTALAAGAYGCLWGIVDGRWTPPRGLVRAAGAVVLVGVVVAGAAGAFALTERVEDPASFVQQRWEAFKTNDRTGEEQSRYLSASGQGRFSLWQVAWKDLASHPVLGVGTQNYEATYYQLREDASTGSVRQPHSLPLEVLGERGVVGGALFFGFLLVCVVTSARARLGRLSSEGKAQVGALTAAVVYWFVHSSADWFWQLPAVTLPAMVYLAMLVTPWRRSETRPLSLPLRTLAVGAAVLSVAAIAPLYLADRYLARSYEAQAPDDALVLVERAQAINPLDYWLRRREAELAVEAGEGERAENAYRAAVRLNPEHYAPYVLQARFYERQGRTAEALRLYQRALALNPLSAELNRQAIPLTARVPGRRIVVRVVGENNAEKGRLTLVTREIAPEGEQEARAVPPGSDGILFSSSVGIETPLSGGDANEPLSVAFADGNGGIVAVRALDAAGGAQALPPSGYRLAVVTGRRSLEGNGVGRGDKIVLAASQEADSR